MRIITGSARGSRLKTPKGLDTRPTADRVKESVFSILGSRVVDARVLDLFAGTGNLGLESLSRGAKQAVFVDIDTAGVIRYNATQTQLADQSEVYRTDVYKALEKLIQAGKQFELIFCDPPYNNGHSTKVLGKLDHSSLLVAKGVIILEHSRHESIEIELDSLEIVRTERYGETNITFFQYKQS